MTHQITLGIDADGWADLAARLDAAGISYARGTSREMTGEQFAVTVVLPTTLAAVQIVATFLAARYGNSAKREKPPRITIRKRTIFAKDFSVSEVETIIGEPLKSDE